MEKEEYDNKAFKPAKTEVKKKKTATFSDVVKYSQAKGISYMEAKKKLLGAG